MTSSQLRWLSNSRRVGEDHIATTGCSTLFGVCFHPTLSSGYRALMLPSKVTILPWNSTQNKFSCYKHIFLTGIMGTKISLVLEWREVFRRTTQTRWKIYFFYESYCSLQLDEQKNRTKCLLKDQRCFG